MCSDYDDRVKNLLETTPGCYFNHGGCSFVTSQTLHAVTTQLGLEHRLGNAVADLRTAAEKRTLYKLAAATVGADAKDIAITDSHTTGWEKALRGILEALDQLQKSGIEQIQEQILARSCRIWEELQAITGVICLHDTAPNHGMVSFNVTGYCPSVVRERLISAGIEVAANQAAFTPLDMQTRQLDGMVRVTPHACTTWEEVEMLVEVIRELCQTGQ